VAVDLPNQPVAHAGTRRRNAMIDARLSEADRPEADALVSAIEAVSHMAHRAAQTSQPSLTRRERQLAEVLMLLIHGDRARAAGLAAEHSAEFNEDEDALALMATWVPLSE
jgi:hypothetical protein